MYSEKWNAENLVNALRGLAIKGMSFWRGRLWPGIKAWLAALYTLMRQRVLPAVGSGSTRIKGELVKIHHRQNWFQRCSTTLGGNAAGLGMALLSTEVVESLVETRDFSNLWGLLAERPVVSETTFKVLSFSIEYLLALLVFTLTEFYISEYKRKRKGSVDDAAVTDNERAG